MNFENAFSIRKRFDPDFIFEVNEEYLSEMRLESYRIRRELQYIKNKRRELSIIKDYIHKNFPELNSYELRAILIGYLTNLEGIKEEFLKGNKLSVKTVNKILDKKDELNKKLITLKIHAELVRIEVRDYEDELKELAYKHP